MDYFVVIGDLVESRVSQERVRLQEQLRQGCSRASQLARKADSLLSPYTITLGDEFQAVLKHPKDIFRQCLELAMAIHPAQLRFSFGIGKISTAINRKTALEMDGPAFHRAREGIERLKKGRERILFLKEEPDHLLALISALTSHGWATLESARSRSRLDITALLLTGLNGRQIADELGKAEPTVSKAIDRAALEPLCRAFKKSEVLLTEALKD